jgi:hypothetical protein
MGRPFAFETAKEPFGRCIGQALAFPTHTTAYPLGREQPLVRLTCILTPPIRMMAEPYRQRQRRLHQCRIAMRAHRPPDDCARIHV